MEPAAVKSFVYDEQSLQENVVKVFRSAKVVKGGRRFSFSALVAVGNRAGLVGIGYGKANEVPQAVEKAIKEAKKTLYKVTLFERTIPHQVTSKSGATKITMVPAGPGTGVIAGSAARAVLELAGVQDVLTKVYGGSSIKNIVKVTLKGLLKLRSKEMVEASRGVMVNVVKKT